MPSQPRSRIERHKPEGLGLGRLDNLPDVHVHAVAEEGEFVYQGDVDTPKNILEQLGHLSAFGGRYWVNLLHYIAVELRGPLGASWSYSTYDLGDIVDGVAPVTRIYALGGKSQV